MTDDSRLSIAEQVIAQVRKQAAKGLETYGRALAPFNGRDPLQDLLEELVDAAKYTKTAMIERDALLAKVERAVEILTVGRRMIADGDDQAWEVITRALDALHSAPGEIT